MTAFADGGRVFAANGQLFTRGSEMFRSIDHPDENWLERIWKHDKDTLGWGLVYIMLGVGGVFAGGYGGEYSAAFLGTKLYTLFGF